MADAEAYEIQTVEIPVDEDEIQQCQSECRQCSSLTPILKHILTHLSDTTQHDDKDEVTISYRGFNQKLSWHYECEYCTYKSFYHQEIVQHSRRKHAVATATRGKLFSHYTKPKISTSTNSARRVAKRPLPQYTPPRTSAAKTSRSLLKNAASSAKDVEIEVATRTLRKDSTGTAATSVVSAPFEATISNQGDSDGDESLELAVDQIVGSAESSSQEEVVPFKKERFCHFTLVAMDEAGNTWDMKEVPPNYPLRAEYNRLLKSSLQTYGYWNAELSIQDIPKETLDKIIAEARTRHPAFSVGAIFQSIKMKMQRKRYDTLKRVRKERRAEGDG